MKKFAAILSLLLMGTAAQAKVTLPAIISDNMVLQSQTDATLWGWANPGETVKITPSWAPTQPVTVTAAADSTWTCTVATPPATDTPQTLTFKGRRNTVKVANILIGEVWLCTGQSNMEFTVGENKEISWWKSGMVDADEQLRDADYPSIRLFTVPYTLSPLQAQKDTKAQWVECTPKTAYDFSAVGFVFGRELHNTLHRPVGLITVAKGDTHVESWLKPELMQGNPFYDEVYEKYGLDKVEESKRPHKIPSGLWNGMIRPILGYSVKGNIWYQGEANAERSEKYQAVFTTLIDSWRQEWNQPDMPFYFVQIAPFHKQPAAIRQAQLDTWQSDLKHIGMVVTTDVGDSLDIHPRNKLIPGRRLAAWALNRDYRRADIACESPVYQSVRFADSKAILTFANTGTGLTTPEGQTPTGFFIAGPDRVFYPAQATVKGNTVTVSSPQVKHPAAVRYGFDNYFRVNLINSHGLPASPFRTDAWCE